MRINAVAFANRGNFPIVINYALFDGKHSVSYGVFIKQTSTVAMVEVFHF